MDQADLVGLRALQSRQAGVVSRRQARDLGLGDVHVARQLRRREWARIHPGVFVDHTGPPTREQRAWAAVLAHAPAALSGWSSLRADGLFLDRDDGVVHVVVPAARRARPAPDVRVRRLGDWAAQVRDGLHPPRTRLEHAALTAASACRTDDAAAAVLGDVVQSRRTTGARLAATLATMTRLPRRALLAEVVGDVTAGARSALERRYLRDVERAHGLPEGARQVRTLDEASGAVTYCDVRYAYDVRVELDGRVGHDPAAAQWRDLERDLASAARGDLTLRARWGTVLTPCRLAAVVAGVLRCRGWQGSPRRCGPGCDVDLPG
ncbi:type IV toxin-antitoxin system AbiEi family antitoxin domain-containing protein [Nocardioides perillae]|uniref:Transcriptional regulator, AbiEi antitoxin, Type IV TA system n=1 Tax=Nocardioides perillae TaxID=1119534 RepID=A0A7Y9RRY8_9ACTN|nr:type IV toxin-antitoxin system AbiEi family antitoxin domain-containing protein [Nocardioides perillae]NYG55492.1 hypothetical protein [Nocardioides perillae]